MAGRPCVCQAQRGFFVSLRFFYYLWWNQCHLQLSWGLNSEATHNRQDGCWQQTNKQKNTKGNKDVEMWLNGNPYALLMGMQNGTVENATQIPQNLKTKPPYDPHKPSSGYVLKCGSQGDMNTLMFVAELVTTASRRNNPDAGDK